MTFVLGQPNFMEDGSCCGVWGLTTSDCPHLSRCEACYAPNRFGHEGYRAYFNDKERLGVYGFVGAGATEISLSEASRLCRRIRWDFARTVGAFWTNVASSGDPNCREKCSSKGEWPKFAAGGEVTQTLGPFHYNRLGRMHLYRMSSSEQT